MINIYVMINAIVPMSQGIDIVYEEQKRINRLRRTRGYRPGYIHRKFYFALCSMCGSPDHSFMWMFTRLKSMTNSFKTKCGQRFNLFLTEAKMTRIAAHNILVNKLIMTW